MYLLCRPDFSTSLYITAISNFCLVHMIHKVCIFKQEFKISIIDNLLWYKGKYFICRSYIGISLYIKAIFDFHLNYLMHNLDFEVGYRVVLLHYIKCSCFLNYSLFHFIHSILLWSCLFTVAGDVFILKWHPYHEMPIFYRCFK